MIKVKMIKGQVWYFTFKALF